MKKVWLGIVLLAGSALAGPRIGVGIGFGAPAPVTVVRPVCPGPGYVWVEGYYASNGIWVPGYWQAPVVGVAVAPHYVAPRYFAYERGWDFRHEFRR
jgi:hypothetical protein